MANIRGHGVLKNISFIASSILAVWVSVALADNSAIDVSPVSQTTCCDSVTYTVRISNSLASREDFKIYVEAYDDIMALLQPNFITVPAKSSEELIMLVKPDCNIAPGDYTIAVRSESYKACEDSCGVCPYTSGEAEVILTVPEGCLAINEPVIPQPPEGAEPQSGQGMAGAPNTGDASALGSDSLPASEQPGGSPTGASVTRSSDNYLVIATLFALFAVLAVMLLIVKKESKKESKEESKKASKDSGVCST